jgi:hypothetical protein
MGYKINQMIDHHMNNFNRYAMCRSHAGADQRAIGPAAAIASACLAEAAVPPQRAESSRVRLLNEVASHS